jgi:hypothetical protein
MLFKGGGGALPGRRRVIETEDVAAVAVDQQEITVAVDGENAATNAA